MWIYAATVSLSAFLLFLLQPMIAKMILPWLGGSASVWATCVLFFQSLLLAGYVYAHWAVEHVPPRVRFLLHAALLAASCLALPVALNPDWKPAGGENPVLRILLLLAAAAGLPYFVLSTTTPLVQSWYAARRERPLPYRLFALSNLASLAALLAYPFLIEPRVGLRLQSRLWSAVYALFVALTAASMWLGRRASAVPVDGGDGAARPGARRRLLWVALSWCASVLFLAVTGHLCQNVASVPFLWVVPLGVYLLTLIIAFDHERWYVPFLYHLLVPPALLFMCLGVVKIDPPLSMKIVIPLFCTALFVCCMFCHGELARRKPHPRYLTSFYLMVSLGGALGGVFVAVLAPLAFRVPIELPLGMAGCAVLAALLLWGQSSKGFLSALGVLVFMPFFLWLEMGQFLRGTQVVVRDFYGPLRVTESPLSGGTGRVRTLHSGTVVHGSQFTDAGRRRLATTYYGPRSGAGLAIASIRHAGARVGVIGLGTGTLATYGRPGDTYRFYEINPQVVRLARQQFTFLQDSAAQIEIVLGDARLSLESEPPQRYDVLVVDAFSSDAVPVHLLTREAGRLYLKHLAPDGILALHISNSYLDLEPVVAGMAASAGKFADLVSSPREKENDISPATWALVPMIPSVLQDPLFQGHVRFLGKRNLRVWTDDYSSLFQVMK